MPGGTFLVGQQMIRPDIYIRTVNIGEPALGRTTQGVVGAIFRSNWGPVGIPTDVRTFDELDRIYGSAATVDVPKEALRGLAQSVMALRVGSGGTKATRTLADTTGTPVNVARIDAKWVGTRGNAFTVTIRDSLIDPTNFREMVVYEGTTQRQNFFFPKSGSPASTGSEVDDLVAAVLAVPSDWVTVVKLADGNGVMASITQQSLSTGADPGGGTYTNSDYTSAMAAIEAVPFNVLALDTTDTTTFVSMQAWLARVNSQGKHVLAVIGSPTTVAWDTGGTNRVAIGNSFNDPNIVYVGDGFTRTDGSLVDGAYAAARVAGRIAGTSITRSLTHMVIDGASDVRFLSGGTMQAAPTHAQAEQAVLNGILMFTPTPAGQVQIDYGITTFITPDAERDLGWSKIRRVKTRYYLMDRIAATWSPLIGQINNDEGGRASLRASAQRIINMMVQEGALRDGTVTDDPANPPAGDSAWFRAEVNDLDSAEKIYLTLGLSFAPVSA